MCRFLVSKCYIIQYFVCLIFVDSEEVCSKYDIFPYNILHLDYSVNDKDSKQSTMKG